MPTVYKWYPGHYIIGAGETKNLTTLLNGIAGTGTNNIPNIVGVQMRYVWKDLEPSKGVYNFDGVKADLQTLKNYSASSGRHLSMRILFQFKGLNGRGAPAYLRPGQPDYETAYGIGTYTWGSAENPDTINEHPALWIPAVEERLALFVEAMGRELDSVGRAEGDIRYHISTFDFNETSWGNNNGVALTNAQATAQKDALLRLHGRAKAAWPTTIVGHFVNFPHNGSFSVVNTMCPTMLETGVSLGGPDTFWNDSSLENGVFRRYGAASGVTAVCPSIQNQNWEHWTHEDATPGSDGILIYNISHLHDANGQPTLQNLYDRVTTAGAMVNGTFRAGLRGTHVAWQGATWRLHNADGSFSNITPWNLIRSYFLNKWQTGPDAGNSTPGVITAIPSRLETTPPTSPGAVSISLALDSGPDTNDLTTSSTALVVSGAASGATVQYATSSAGPWSAALPAPVIGSNTWYARQVVSGVPGPASAALTFTFDNAAPELVSATVDGTVVFLTYSDFLKITNATGFKPPPAAFVFKANSVAIPVTGVFVNEDLKRVRIDLGTAVTAGATTTISYTQNTAGTNRTQDLAGNYAVNLVDQVVTNNTGVAAPTTTVTVSAVAGVVAGGFINIAAPTVAGTISAPLGTGEQIEVQRSSLGGAFIGIGLIGASGTAWTFEDSALAEGSHSYRARVRNGDLLGAFGATFAITTDFTGPQAPAVSSTTVGWNVAATVSGTWGGAAGDTLSVTVGDTTYSTSSGLTISGTSWTLALPVLPSGRYALSARVTDRAGNAALNEEPAELVVKHRPSINHARLALARRRV